MRSANPPLDSDIRGSEAPHSLRRHFVSYRKILSVVAALLAISSTDVLAQAKGGVGSFTPGYTGLGPVIGLGGIGDASVAIGGRFERAIKDLPSMGNGILGFGIDVNYYSYSRTFPAGYRESWSYMPIGFSANYHFRLDDREWDPFLGIGLGYSIESVSGGGIGYSASSGLYLIARAGARYFFSPGMAVQADVGAGAATLSLGLIFKL
jgi:hypothetical protein